MFRYLLAIASMAMVAAYASDSALRANAIPPSTVVATRDAGVRDLRDAYRVAVCKRIAAGETACEGVLLRLAGEPPTPTLPSAENLAQKYRIAFVPGLFSECFEQFARPFADVQPDLREDGFTVDYFQVSGRGTAAQNAARLARHFLAASGDPRPIILFAYSKGLVDVLEFVVRYPLAAKRIAAIVAVAGAANGSPLADDLHAIYRDWGGNSRSRAATRGPALR